MYKIIMVCLLVFISCGDQTGGEDNDCSYPVADSGDDYMEYSFIPEEKEVLVIPYQNGSKKMISFYNMSNKKKNIKLHLDEDRYEDDNYECGVAKTSVAYARPPSYREELNLDVGEYREINISDVFDNDIMNCSVSCHLDIYEGGKLTTYLDFNDRKKFYHSDLDGVVLEDLFFGNGWWNNYDRKYVEVITEDIYTEGPSKRTIYKNITFKVSGSFYGEFIIDFSGNEYFDNLTRVAIQEVISPDLEFTRYENYLKVDTSEVSLMSENYEVNVKVSVEREVNKDTMTHFTVRKCFYNNCTIEEQRIKSYVLIISKDKIDENDNVINF